MVVFIIVFTPQADITLQKDTQAMRTRSNSIDSFVSDLENGFLETVLRATTQKTLLSLAWYIKDQDFIQSDTKFAEYFRQVMYDGTIGDPPKPIDDYTKKFTGKDIMNGHTLKDWSEKIKDNAKKTLNVDVTITIDPTYPTKPTTIKISQDPKFGTSWTTDVEMKVDITVISEVGTWKKTGLLIKTSTNIEGLQDPYYLKNADKVLSRPIKNSAATFNEWNINKVETTLTAGAYTHWQSSDAPNFLSRFYNSIAASSCCGIESFVNPNDLSTNNPMNSYLDYKYWKGGLYCPSPPNPGLFKINGFPQQFQDFRIDGNNQVKYKIQNSEVSPTCPPI